jgi:SAM-dependent methyltransferase
MNKEKLTVATQDVAAWERAEVQRSAQEATSTPDEELLVPASELARYAAPAAETSFPLEYAYHLLGDVRGQMVLDYGCGHGENTLLLLQRGARVLAMDLSHSLAKLAQRRLEMNGVSGAVQFMAASAHAVPLPSESVDVVFGIAILHHLDLELAASEVYRVLRPGGRAIFQEPVRSSRAMRGVRSLFSYQQEDVSPYERPLTDPELSDFSRCFEVRHKRAFQLPHVRLGHVLKINRERLFELYALDSRILRRFPMLSHYAAVRVVELRKPDATARN